MKMVLIKWEGRITRILAADIATFELSPEILPKNFLAIEMENWAWSVGHSFCTKVKSFNVTVYTEPYSIQYSMYCTVLYVLAEIVLYIHHGTSVRQHCSYSTNKGSPHITGPKFHCSEYVKNKNTYFFVNLCSLMDMKISI